MKEIAVISGKGGTGKTTLTICMIPYFSKLLVADCDVDAPDIDIILENKLIAKETFFGVKKPIIDKEKCNLCGKCFKHCKFEAIDKKIFINYFKCESCGVCEYVCPQKAIKMQDWKTGDLFFSKIKNGFFVFAKLLAGEEASGKLVFAVRKKARELAEENKLDTILIDGAPGIACNVISSITRVKLVIIVVEVSLSGFHDFVRVYELTKKFALKVFVVINKFDLCLEVAKKIEEFCKKNNLDVALKIPFNKQLVTSVVQKIIPSLDEKNKEFFEKIKFSKFIENLKKNL